MHTLYLSFIRLTLLLVSMLASSAIIADSFTSLLMPGPVIKAHEEYEKDCDQCHDTTDDRNQGQLCIHCHDHENILDDLSNKTGFHGQLPSPARTDCQHCHTEHEGRDAKVVLLNPSTFDHRKTDFLLKGTHEKISCDSCHEPDKKYSEAPSDCYSCHEKTDVHDGKQGKKCGDCHTEKNWKETEFDHDKTDFPLKDAHKKASCAACHINQIYKDTPKTCFDCHQINDAHRGDFGKKCDGCHNSKKWHEIHFDHNKKTDFALYGKHKKAACNSCHEPGDVKSDEAKKKLPKQCYGCHKNDDSHKGQFGKKCETCHASESWQKQKFDHDKKTDFALRGKHKKTACSQCHKDDLYQDKKINSKKTGAKKIISKCIDCHKKDDVHKGEQGKKCDNCHNEEGWRSNVLFDHDLTNFPLIGMHAVTQCEECHLSAEYGATKSECNVCHADDDVHKTRLGTDCETCHTPNLWLIWFFDHDKATDFAIDGAHKELGCYDCHQTKTKDKVKASKDCISCHRSRDVHNRQFGRRCGDCHSTESFKDINIKR